MHGTTEGNNHPVNERSEMALGRCLVDGDPETASLARRTRRKTFGASLAIEVFLLVLLVATTLAVYKPRGMTPYGWRKQHEQREASTP